MQTNCWNNTLKQAATALLAVVATACGEGPSERLPVLGPYTVEDRVVDGRLKTDTVFTRIRPFSFTDQDGNEVSETTVEGKVYVTDFFFTSCPTICPKMKQQMLRVYEAFADEPGLVLLSHSIDPKRDSVGRLRDFAAKLDIESSRWHLVTGEKDSIYSMARHYMIAAQEDALAPGGYAHSGAFLLVDRNRQIRGIYDGTDAKEVDKLMEDIRILLAEQTPAK